MSLEVIEESVEQLAEYSTIPIAFQVTSKLMPKLIQNGLEGIHLVQEPAPEPYVKDYDREKGEGPTRWLKRWDISNWGVLSVFETDTRIGGAVIAWRTPELGMLEDRDDLAVLWDIRIHPDYRGKQIGTLLFKSVVKWARSRRCRDLKIETQNINVPACRFYAQQGCRLQSITIGAYAELPEEIELIWHLEL